MQYFFYGLRRKLWKHTVSRSAPKFRYRSGLDSLDLRLHLSRQPKCIHLHGLMASWAPKRCLTWKLYQHLSRLILLPAFFFFLASGGISKFLSFRLGSIFCRASKNWIWNHANVGNRGKKKRALISNISMADLLENFQNFVSHMSKSSIQIIKKKTQHEFWLRETENFRNSSWVPLVLKRSRSQHHELKKAFEGSPWNLSHGWIFGSWPDVGFWRGGNPTGNHQMRGPCSQLAQILPSHSPECVAAIRCSSNTPILRVAAKFKSLWDRSCT